MPKDSRKVKLRPDNEAGVLESNAEQNPEPSRAATDARGGNGTFATKTIPSDPSGVALTPASAERAELQTMYQNLETINRPKPEGTLARPFVASLLGLIGGIVGALLILLDTGGFVTKIIGQPSDGSGSKTVIIERREKVNVPWQESKDATYTQVQKNIFSVYRIKTPPSVPKATDKKNSPPPIAESWYYPEHQTGVAVALSSDGWLLTTSEVLSEEKTQYGVMVDRVVFPVKKIIHDPFSSLLVVKINIDHLTAVTFADSVPTVGNLILSASRTGTVFQGSPGFITRVEYYQSLSAKRSMSTEKLEVSFSSTEVAGLTPGSAVLTPGGELIGLTNKKTDTVIPTAFIQKKLKDIFKEEKITRTFFGLDYTPLAFVGVDTLPSTPGAWEEGLHIDSVDAKSPADKAGLLVDDILIKMENEPITAEENFSQMIQNYPPGTKLTFDVLRNLENIKVTVVLEAFKP